MTKKEILKNRKGEIVYPITHAKCIKTEDNSDVATQRYVDKATADILNSSPEQLETINRLSQVLVT